MIHYGIAFIMTLAIIAIAYYKFIKLRWLILVGASIYLISFGELQYSISVNHHYDASGEAYDYILVFGGGLKRNNDVRDAVAERLDQAMAADRDGTATYILSGGLGTDRRPDESVAMGDYLMAHGVSGERLMYESDSTSTWENLVYSKSLIGDANLEHVKVLGVSSDFHMQRIGFLSDRLSFDMDLLPAVTPWYDRLHSMPREYFATIKSLIVDRPMGTGKAVVAHTSHAKSITSANKYSPIQYAVTHDHVINEVSIAAVGDVMVHRSQLIRADGPEGFDFSPSFQWVAPYIQAEDYAIANLETTLAGANGQRRIRTEKFYKGYSGYPVFNAPDILADNLKDAGFDMIFTANNHTLDSKESGVLRTLEILEDRGFDYTGAYRSEEEANDPLIIEVNGISFGIINYTYAMNGFWLREEEDYMINHLGNYQDDRIQQMFDQVKAMDALDPDYVVVALHYGIEYVTVPDGRIQRPLIDGLFAHGADIILGGHPHVLQPFEVRELEREDGSVEKGVVIYSLGNFISSQRHMYTNKDTDYGLIFSLDFRQTDDEAPIIESIRMTPTYVHWTREDLEIIPILDVPESLELTYEDDVRLARGREEIIPHLMTYWDGQWQIEGHEIVIDLN